MIIMCYSELFFMILREVFLLISPESLHQEDIIKINKTNRATPPKTKST